MDTVNDTPLKLAWLVGKVQPPADSLTLIVKGGFTLVPGKKALFSENPDDGAILGDMFLEDNPEASLTYANDLVLYKPKADLTLTGVAYPQPGEAGCRVTFSVGNWEKSLAIFNDRFWRWGKATPPEPFAADQANIPITYENAYGGQSYSYNPVGKGFDKQIGESGEQIQPLPNVESVDSYLSSPSQTASPAGFGPLKDNWADKTAIKGTYSDTWLKEQFPYFPPDFDWGYFNAAPQDQQVEYLNGDESLYFQNLRPELSDYNAQLPGKRPRLFLRGNIEGKTFFQEVTLRLDTLHVDMETMTVNLVWRGIVGVLSDEFEEIDIAALFVEELDEAPLPDTTYAALIDEKLATPDTEHALEPFVDENGHDIAVEEVDTEVPESSEQDSADKTPEGVEEVDVEAFFEEQYDYLKKQLKDAGVDQEFIDPIGPGMDAEAYMQKVADTYNIDLQEAEVLVEKAQNDLVELFEAHGHDASFLKTMTSQNNTFMDESEDETIAPDPDAETPELSKDYLAGADLTNRDLSDRDFSGFDFSGTDFTGANLTQSKFTGADLSGAKLDKVQASNAIFSDAILSSVSANEADFSGAQIDNCSAQQASFVKARFDNANLDDTDFTESTMPGCSFASSNLNNTLMELCDLSQSQFIQAQAFRCDFNSSNMREVHCEKSLFNEGVFNNARLTLAYFVECELQDASFENVNGKNATFSACQLINLRAGEGSDLSQCSFHGGDGSGAMFYGSNLTRTTFANISLANSDFNSAELYLTQFEQCNMTQTDFSKANLTETGLARINLFEASFGKATLLRADLRSSNLYGAEFHQAKIEDSQLGGANIGQTKIELGLVK